MTKIPFLNDEQDVIDFISTIRGRNALQDWLEDEASTKEVMEVVDLFNEVIDYINKKYRKDEK